VPDPGPAGHGDRVAVLADDLIWGERLASAVRASGAEPVRLRSSADLAECLDAAAGSPGEESSLAGLVVDLTARAYDAVAAIGAASDVRIPVLAVGQHDDLELRRRARAAGAGRVVAYRGMAEAGPALVARWRSLAQRAAAR
jgi:hypothetical protein